MKRYLTASLLVIASLMSSATLADDNLTKAKSDPIFERLEVLADALALVQDSYVEEIDSDTLLEGALNGALSSLDPHSSSIPPVTYT